MHPVFLNRPVLLMAALAGGAPLSAQTLADADSLLARGDTNGAIAVYDAMLKRDIRNAEAHYRAGVLHMTRHEPGKELSPPRRKAEEHFRYATRFEGDSAKYWLALAELFRGEDISTTRIQVSGLVNRAREAARRTGSEAQLAEIEFRAARVDWERYEHYGRRYMFQAFDGFVDEHQFMHDWRYVERLLEAGLRPDPTGRGEEALTAAEVHVRQALAADPSHVPAVGLAMVIFAEFNRWTEALPIARRAVRAAPDRGALWTLLGLASARAGRWPDAQAAFDTALARLPPAERAPYENIGLLLRWADQLAWDQKGPLTRVRTDSLYWNVANPLLLTETNEARVEFLARLTYVMHRWGDPLRGHRGFTSDMGAVYVRYGPPDLWMNVGRGSLDGVGLGRATILWIYPRHRLRFVFGLVPGFNRTYFAGDFSREQFRTAVDQRPMMFENVPLVGSLDTVAVQLVQFKAEEADRTDVGVFALFPIGRMVSASGVSDVSVTSGAIVQHEDGTEVERVRRDELIRTTSDDQTEHRTWRMTLPPSHYLLRVEAHVSQLDRGARSLTEIDIRRFAATGLELSDVLLARRVEPRDSTYARWTDFLIEPSAGRYLPGEPMGLLWEIYGLERDSTGVARYAVSLRITVTEIARRGFFAEIVGGVGDAMGLTAEGDDQVELVYDRDGSAPGDVQVEHLAIDLRDAPEGRYTITVTIHDRIADRTRAVTSRFDISSAPLEASMLPLQR